MTTNTTDPKKTNSSFKKFTAEEKKEWLENKIKEDEALMEANLVELRDVFVNGIKNYLEDPKHKPWEKSWIKIMNPDSSEFPQKFVDMHQYGYNNALKLLIASEKRGYIDNRWLTLSEARKLKLEFVGDKKFDAVNICRPIVQKGYGQSSVSEVELTKSEKANEARRLQALSDATGSKYNPENVPSTKKVYRSAPVQRYTFFKAYNLSLFKGFEASPLMGFQRNEASFRSEDAQKILNHIGCKIRFGYNSAFFLSTDNDKDVDNYVCMPLPTQFKSEEAFIHCLNHELIHMTGHNSRLARKKSAFYQKLNAQEAKAFEELVAEVGSALIGIKLGISNVEMRDSHYAYLASWLSGLNGDLDYISEAMKFANQAIYHIEKTVRDNIEKGITSDIQNASDLMLSQEPLNNSGFPVISESDFSQTLQ